MYINSPCRSYLKCLCQEEGAAPALGLSQVAAGTADQKAYPDKRGGRGGARRSATGGGGEESRGSRSVRALRPAGCAEAPPREMGPL